MNWNEFVTLATTIAKQRGFDPGVITSQAAVESFRGRAAPGNNFFGMKGSGTAGAQFMPTQEYVNGQYVNTADSFAAYNTPADSINAYLDLIQSWPDAWKVRNDPEQLIKAIKAHGYATSPTYVKTVQNTPEYRSLAGTLSGGINAVEQGLQSLGDSLGQVFSPVGQPAVQRGGQTGGNTAKIYDASPSGKPQLISQYKGENYDKPFFSLPQFSMPSVDFSSVPNAIKDRFQSLANLGRKPPQQFSSPIPDSQVDPNTGLPVPRGEVPLSIQQQDAKKRGIPTPEAYHISKVLPFLTGQGGQQ